MLFFMLQVPPRSPLFIFGLILLMLNLALLSLEVVLSIIVTPCKGITYHHEVASTPLGEVSRESCSVSSFGGPADELHPFTKSSEAGLG